MKFTKLILAITFVAASAFLCACDDSSSAKDEAPVETTPTQTRTQSDTFTKHEEFSYTFSLDEEGCGWKADITDVDFKFGPGSSVEVTIKDADETETLTGMYRESKNDQGEQYYMIQIKGLSEITLNYFPNGGAISIFDNNFITLVATDIKDVQEYEARLCAE